MNTIDDIFVRESMGDTMYIKYLRQKIQELKSENEKLKTELNVQRQRTDCI